MKIPTLSKDEIELKAEEFIEFFDKSVIENPQYTPLIFFVEKLKKEFNIIFDFSQNLGESKSGRNILGKCVLRPLSILIDNSILETERFPFTLAHELGHLVLHRKVELSKEEYNTIIDTEINFNTGKKKLQTPRDWIEWQANHFASAVLLPRNTIITEIKRIQKEMGINRNLGFIYLENESYSSRDFNYILSELKAIYRVNNKNIEYRLSDLGVLIDRRLKNVKHISELLREE